MLKVEVRKRVDFEDHVIHLLNTPPTHTHTLRQLLIRIWKLKSYKVIQDYRAEKP